MQFSFPFIKKNNQEDVYFGLFLKEEEAVGFVLEKRGNHLEISAEERINLVNGWDNIIEYVDELIFSLEQKTKKHLEKVIFFVYSHLIDQNTKDIKKTYLSVFKNLVKHLELKPLGYIECYEAIASYYEKKDQSPLTAILIELDKSNIGVFVYKGGHKTFGKTVARTQSIVDDLETVFADVKGDMMLPSRIILYDSNNLDSESTTILSHRWNTELFVQYPRVEIVKPNELHKGLITIFEYQVKTSAFDEKEEEIIPEKKEVLGFVIGEEVEKEEKEVPLDVSLSQSKEVQVTKKNEPEENNFNFEETKEDIKKTKSLPLLSYLQNLFSKFSIKFSMIKSLSKLSSIPVIIPAGIFLILISLFFIEYFFHKANLTVLLPARAMSKSLDENIPLDEKSEGGIQIKTATLSLDYNEKKTTTGKRDVGEKAKGEVTINSFDSKERVFSKGTIFEVNNVKFVLDDEVKVASYSEKIIDTSTARIPGTNKGKVTAVEIGTEGNITKGQKLKIADLSLSDFFAVSNAAFTGGSKKQVKTVAKQDAEDIKKTILEKAQEEANNKIINDSQNNDILLDSLTDTEFDSLQLSKEIGEEADQLSIKATVNTVYYTFSRQQVQSMLKDSFKEEVPTGFYLNQDKISFEVKDVEKNKNEITIKIKAKASAIKDVSKDDIISKILGKKKDNLENILKEEFQASGYEVTMKTPIFFLGNWLPFFKKNIDLKVSSL